MAARDRTDVLRQLKTARDQREQARDDLVQKLILIDSLNSRIDVLLGRLSHVH